MTPKLQRCAIYTRKSSEEGLDQSFNSLDAQREACSAFISSQKGEGWKELLGRYDDGGYSGGNMERPGLARLLADIEANKIDIVVVYKVDRLTRSLADFARIVDRFDCNSVSFVSVTQAFNTTTSMGRLTLNVLLSFAQFEREVTGERIRDKIAASKKKGMWMGGNSPFGYAPHERSLKIVPAEAEIIRWIFARYLELNSVQALRAAMREKGIVSRMRTSASGRTTGGHAFSRGAIFHLLQNRVYIGEVVHGELVWPGLHDPIIDKATFEAVQAHLAKSVVPRRERQKRSPALLIGLIRDACGEPMSPVTARKGQTSWRYYVSARLQQGDAVGSPAGPLRRVSAVRVEQLVVDRLRDLVGDQLASWPALRPLVSSITVHADKLVLTLNAAARSKAISELPATQPDGSTLVVIPAYLKRSGKVRLEAGPTGRRQGRRVNRALVAGIRRAHRELAKIGIHPAGRELFDRDCQSLGDPYLRSLVRLGFLAPDIQEAIFDGRQPEALSLQVLREQKIPLSWEDQRRQLGFQA